MLGLRSMLRGTLPASPERAFPAAPVVLALAFAPLPAAGQAATGGPLDFLEPLIGTWAGDSAWVAENPGMEDLVPISFRWGPTRYSIIDQAALPVRGQLYTVSQITWNPTARRAEFIATQSNDSLLFTGFYEPIGDRDIRRTYDVHYPDGSVVPFRETFFFLGPDAFDWLTEWNPEGRWTPRRGSGAPEFRMRRRIADVQDELAGLGPWEGTWEADDGRAVVVRPLREGSAYQLIARAPDQRREGLLAWDPHAVGLRSVEVDRDGTLHRVAWSFDGTTLVRAVDRFDPAGHVTRWVEQWTPEEDHGCFLVRHADREGPADGARFCRLSGGGSGAGR